jgi:hypothetical protein
LGSRRISWIATVAVETEVRVVSVGMTLVFNAAFRLEGIAGVYAGPNDPQIGQISSKISSTQLLDTSSLRLLLLFL